MLGFRFCAEVVILGFGNEIQGIQTQEYDPTNNADTNVTSSLKRISKCFITRFSKSVHMWKENL
jgi:hypothetical protein